MRSLVVDDARVTQLILERILSGYGDCQIAKNATEATQFFGQAFEEGRPYDLVCLDMGLPDYSGVELLTKIRAFEEDRIPLGGKRARVIAITASSDTATVRAVVQLGDGYMLKPIDRERLIRDIASLGLIPLPEQHAQLVDALSTVCERDVLPVGTIAELMVRMANSIRRQSAVRSGKAVAE